MMNSEFLLYPVFEELRRQGVPLGVSEYVVVLKVMREGRGEFLENVDSLKRLCRLLWAKSREDQDLFDKVFFEKVEIQLINASQLDKGDPGVEPRVTPPFDQHVPQIGESELPDKLEKQTQARTKQQEHTKEQASPLPSPRRLLLPDATTPVEELDKFEHSYQLIPRLPIDRRDMIGTWRHLRRLQREGPLEELDVQATINSICTYGFFLSPVLQPRRRNQATLVLLIDQSSSMEPFSIILEAFVESILRSGLNRQTRIFYFHDCPEGYLFESPKQVGARLLDDDVLPNYCKGNSVLILSDAGAARGRYDSERVECSKKFLKRLSDYTYLYSWLNPMPVKRWIGTTADDIRFLVPMYHLDREGVNDAVNILRGHPFPPEIRLNA
jgi:uncharacterized protein